MSAFEEQALSHYTYLFRAAMKMCYGDVDDAEDIVQETYLRAYQNFDKFDENKSSLITWMYRILSNIRLDDMKWRDRHPVTPMECGEIDRTFDMLFQPHPWYDEKWVIQKLNSTLAEFSADEQAAFKRVMDGERVRDIAEDMGVTPNTVSRRVSAIRNRLKFHLRKYMEVE